MSWGFTKRIERRKAKSYFETRLHALEVDDPVDENLAEIIDVKLALNLEADKEERCWEQRSQANWLSKGDKNTSYFHNFASTRKKTNTIDEIVDQTGNVVSSMEEILAVAANYFSDMFTATTLGDTAGIFNNVRRHTLVMKSILLSVLCPL
ncbi:hypothetical protein GQ457_12G009590 [Hibiscus cannabinus]